MIKWWFLTVFADNLKNYISYSKIYEHCSITYVKSSEQLKKPDVSLHDFLITNKITIFYKQTIQQKLMIKVIFDLKKKFGGKEILARKYW